MPFSHGSYATSLAVTIAVASAGMGRAERIAAPQRIVSAFLCTDEYVFRLIPRERIAGLSYLAGDTHPVVSTIAKQVNGIPGVRASAEQMLALHPDLVVTYQSTNARQTQLLRAAGVRVLEVPWAQSLADVRRVTLMLGGALDASGRAQALVQQMDADLVRARAQASRPAVQTLIYEPNGYTTAGGVTDEILSAAGLKNAGSFARITRSGTIPIEAVLTLAPELLVLNGEHEDEPARADAVLHHPALKALNRHTVVVRTSLVPLLCPGPWSVRVAPQLAKWGRSVHMLAGHSRKP